MNALGLVPRHRPHDGRVQFVTTAKKAGVDEHVIKKIVGHCIDDVAEKSYTKRAIEWIRHFMQCIVSSQILYYYFRRKTVPICELSIIPFQEEIKLPWIGKH